MTVPTRRPAPGPAPLAPEAGVTDGFAIAGALPDPLSGSIDDLYEADNPDLLARWLPVAEWMAVRAEQGMDACAKVASDPPGPRAGGHDAAGRPVWGVNLAQRDHLNLATHPRVLAAAQAALRRHGTQAAGAAPMMGLTPPVLALESAIAGFVAARHAAVLPTGWAAGYGAIRALVRPEDHVVIDTGACAVLHEGARAATRLVHRVAHLSTDAMANRLSRIRDHDPHAGILVVSESVFPLDSDSPDLAALIDLSRRYRATLLVDVSQDLGAMGPTGRGALEGQQVLGEVDLVLGSFAPTLASGGGFVASDHPALPLALRHGCSPSTGCAALSPVQAAAALAALEIVAGAEGAHRRARLMDNILLLRAEMAAAGFEVAGAPAPGVPVRLGGAAEVRRITAALLASGGVVNAVEPPELAGAEGGWRLEVMAEHSADDLRRFAALARAARIRARDPDWRPAPMRAWSEPAVTVVEAWPD